MAETSVKVDEGNKMKKMGEILMEGFVVKSPPVDRINNLGSWHKRYMVLLKIDNQYLGNIKGQKGSLTEGRDESLKTLYCLAYWGSVSDKRKGHKPIRTILLLKSHVVAIQQLSACFPEKFKHVFTFITPDRIFYFDTDNKANQQQWCNKINEAISATECDRANEHLYESIIEVLRMKKEYQRQRSSVESRESLQTNSSCDSKDAGMVDGYYDDDDENDHYKYETMDACLKRSFTGIPMAKPIEPVRRKISVPARLPSAALSSEQQYQQIFNPSLERKFLSSNRIAEDEDIFRPVQNVATKEIEFYDVKVDVQANARLKMSEKRLEIVTDQLYCIFTYTKPKH